jgi:hypothetical protein
MVSFLGWVLVLVAVWMLITAFRRPATEGATAPATTGPNRTYLGGGLLALVAGAGLAVWPSIALARLQPVPLDRTDLWVMNPRTSETAPIRWEGSVLVADLEAGSGRYAVFPVDWDANRFEASFDITFTHLDSAGDVIPLRQPDGSTRMHRRTPLDFAAVCIGVMDQNLANIDDRDHVSGSAIAACFSDDIRLRASDASLLVRTSSATESGKERIDPFFKPGVPTRVELNRKYRCLLAYDGRRNQADLVVREEGGAVVVERRLENLRDFTNSVSWFGISVRGYNRFDKKLDPTKAQTGYTRPTARIRLENLQYRQP